MVTVTDKSARSLMSGAAVVALYAWSGALAQTDETSFDDTPQTPSERADEAGIDTIIVSAQRREENLQDVPISVNAIGREEIRTQDVTDIARLEQLIPGLRLNRTGAAQRPAIRGVYTEAIGLNSDPRIGFYIDEIYQARPQQATAAFVDLERVEVQKGPQGTLFGRNSFGGNIALTTAVPGDTFEAGADVTLGNYDRRRAEGFVSIPLADGLGVRLAGAIERRDGYLESVVTDDADLQDKHEDYVRGTIRWVPESLDDRLEILVRGSYFARGGQGFNAANGKVVGVALDPSLITPPGGSLEFNGETYTFTGTAPGLGGFNGLNPGTGTLFPFTNALRDGIPDVNGADVGIPIPGDYANVYDATPFEDTTQQQFSNVINYDLNDRVRLRSITSYTTFDSEAGGDGDGTPIPLRYFTGGTQSDVFTQEFQIQSTDNSRFQYTAGLYYLDESGKEGSSFYYLNRNYSSAGADALGLPTYFGAGGGIGGSGFGCQFSFTTPADSCALDFTSGNLFDFRTASSAETQSYAVYGQGSYDFTERLTLTLGGRYTIDDKAFKTILQSPGNGTLFAGQFAAEQGFDDPGSYYAVNPFYSDSFNQECGGFTPQGISTDQSDEAVATVPNYFFTVCNEREFEFFTYRVAVDFDLTPDNLLYASYNTGAHSGGFGAGVTAANSPGSITTFDTEFIRAWEVGSKNRFFDNRVQLNVAAFYNILEDLQEQGTQAVVVDGEERNLTTIFNVGKQTAPGAEIELLAEPVEGLTLNLSVNYLRARYDDFPRFAPANFSCFYITEPSCGSGAFPPTAPQNFGVGGGYFPNAQTNPEDFVETDIAGFDFAYIPTDRRVQNSPDWQAQFGAAYEIDLGTAGTLTPQFNTQWSDEYLLSPSAPNLVQESFFKTDARIVWLSRDGQFSAQAFVQNLEDEATLGRITVRANGEIQGTFAEPRFYGVRIGYRY